MLPRPDPNLPRLDGYEVDRVPAFRAAKGYVCPGCGNPIPPRTGHVVAWPDGLVDDRRHWHLHCWRLAANRGRV
ncbi:hypothetical protein FTX61_16310 [Nitriliruptoraceae bacterium ZYF776]|nr:hypothetical protein [Profundirhabdus halotolerans]